MDKKIVSTAITVAVLSIAGVPLFGSAVSRPPSSTALPSSATSSSSAEHATHGIQFQGRVTKGQQFERIIGHGLVFQLTPHAGGWFIDIFPQGGLGANDYGLADIATPPFHGITSLQVEGWHFRNATNTGPNDGSVNAPQAERDFQFVMNESDARIVADAIDRFEEGKTKDFSPPVSFGHGKFVVQHLTLGNFVPGSRAWIESMDWSVRLEFPISTK